jgi:predicted aldo/keto reductase-like oxidoreductase
MRTTTLGRNGPEVGVIGLGCMGMTFSYDMETPRDKAISISVIHRTLDLGMTLIDRRPATGRLPARAAALPARRAARQPGHR